MITAPEISLSFRLFATAIRTQKLVTVVMNHVVGELRDPDFRLPDDFGRILFESGKVHKRRDVHSASRALAQHFFEFDMTLWRDGPVSRNGFNQEDPTALTIVNNDI